MHDMQIEEMLGIFWQPVLSLLHRDPCMRSSMKDFCSACNKLVSSSTSRPLCVISEENASGSSMVCF
jgi:hypothetical protein